MSPIEKIKEAYIRQDWAIIQEAYQDLTGQELNSKEPKLKKTVDKKTKKTKVIKEEPVVKEQETFTSIKKPNSVNPSQKFIKNGEEHTYCGTEKIDLGKSKINLFEDDLSMDTNFIGKPNKPVRRVSQTTRAGYEDSLVDVQCKSCDKWFKAKREFSSHFRCDGCMVRR